MALTIGELVGYLKIEDNAWHRGLARAKKSLNDLRGHLQTSGQHVARFSMGMVQMAIKAGAAASALTSLVNTLGAAGPAMVSMGVAAAGIAAAGLATLLAVTNTIKLGTAGLGDAFKAIASGDMAQYQEALKKLSPAGRDFAESVRKLKPALDQLKLDVQQNLLRGLGAELYKTGQSLVPLAERQFIDLARVLNVTGKEVLGVVRESGNLKTIRGSVDNITAGFKGTASAAAPVVQALIDIVNAGSSVMPRLGDAIGKAASRFAEFVHAKQQTGELAEAFDAGIGKLSEFGRAIRDFGVGIASIFRIGAQQGQTLFGTLSKVAAGFRAFTESADGRKIFGDIFASIHLVADAFGTFLGALRPLLPVIGQFLQVLGGQFAQILVELGPTIADLAQVLLDTLVQILPEVTPFVIALAKGFAAILKAAIPLLKPLAGILEALTPLIDPLVRLAEVIIPPLAAVLDGLAPIIKAVAIALGFVFDAIGVVITAFGHLGDVLGIIADPIGAAKKAVLTMGGHLDELGPKAEKNFGKMVTGARDAAPGFIAAVDGLLAGLGPKFGIAAGAADTAGRDISRSLAGGLEAESGLAWEKIGLIMNGLLGLIDGSRPQFGQKGRDLTKFFSNGMTAEEQDAYNRATSILTGIESIMTGRSAAFNAKGRELTKLFSDGMSSGAGAVFNTAQGIADRVPGFFEGISLFTQGAQITSSLERGINSRVGFLKGLLQQITTFIPSWKGPAARDAQLLTANGVLIMQGLTDGIRSQVPGLQGLLGGVTAGIPGMAGVGGMVGGQAGGGGARVELMIRGDGSDLANAILPGLQKTVRTSGGVAVVFG